MQATIKANTLKALTLFAAVEDIRYYLNGVLLETSARGTFAVATDGAAMAAVRLDTDAAPDCQVIVPLAFVQNMLKIKQAAYAFECPDAPEEGKAYGRAVTAARSRMSALEVDGKFPDWRRACQKVVPSTVPVFYDPKFHARIAKAGEIVGGKRKAPYHITPGANIGCAVLTDVFAAWVMPMRVNLEEMPTGPVWL